jgi:hypothetical protein
LNALTEYGDVVVLLIELLYDIGFVDSVSPSQIAVIFLTGLEGKHVIELILCWSPERTVEWELEFCPAAPPVVVDVGGKQLEDGLFCKLLILLLKEGHYPSLVPRNYAIPPTPTLQLDYSPL